MSHPVHRELSNHRYLREQLEAAFPEAEEETLLDTLEGLTKLTDMLAEVLRSCLEDQSFVVALKARVADLQVRTGRFEERVRKKRDLVAQVMEDAGLKKLVEPDFTVSLRPGRAPLVVLDEEAIPGDFWKPQPAKLDRQGLLAALGGDRDIPGVLLGNSAMTLSVRTR